MILQNNIYRFTNLSQFSNLLHGFSTKNSGSMRPSDPDYSQSLERFCKALGIAPQDLVTMNQVHGKNVVGVSEKDRGTVINAADGLFTQTKKIFLGVVTADCIPLLFYDPQNNIVAAVHAGWRGLFAEIIKETVVQMITKGSDPKEIIVGIGPCIGVCHYDITKQHAEKLLHTFSDWKPFIVEKNEKFFLNLSEVARYQLIQLGVVPTNIETAECCTFEEKELYSYRREGKGFGEMIGIIGQR